MHPSLQTFDSFFEGETNRVARLAAMEVARNPGVRYNPLFIFGGTGTGKSHLLNAIAEEIVGADPSIRLYCDNYSAFVSGSDEYVETGERQLFLSRLSFHDVILIDDLVVDEDWVRFQHEMIDWIDRFIKEKKQLVFTSNRPLLQMTPIDRRFLARVQRGLVVYLRGGGKTVRREIILRAFEEKGVRPEEEAIEHLVDLPVADVRELTGIINRLLLSLEAEDARLTSSWCAARLRRMADRGEIRRLEIPAAVSPPVRAEATREDISSVPDTPVIEVPDMDEELELPEGTDEKPAVEESESEEASVVGVTDKRETVGGIDGVEVDAADLIDETERLILEWDREEDRLLDDL